MISICIPTYNTDCSKLLKILHNQIQDIECNIEVIVLEDGSTTFVHNNANACEKFGFIHVKNKKNLGRAESRVELAKKSNHSWLLFIDADMKPSTDNFILNYYREAINKRPYDVIVGGYSYKNIRRMFSLRLRYGKAREEVSSQIRNNKPFRHLFFGNIMIKKDVFMSIFSKYTNPVYGEDLFLSAMLKAKKYTVLHFNNNTIHLGLEKNREFIQKIEYSGFTMATLHSTNELNLNHIKLVQFYEYINRYKLTKLLLFALRFFLPIYKYTLVWLGGPLVIVDLYRLFHFLKTIENEN